jgi:hypothetical protein
MNKQSKKVPHCTQRATAADKYHSKPKLSPPTCVRSKAQQRASIAGQAELCMGGHGGAIQMSSYRNFLLAGIAALGLVAGADSASAQMQNGAPQINQQQTTQPNASNGIGNQTQRRGMSGPAAQNENRGAQQNAPQQNAQGTAHVNPSMSQSGANRNNRNAQNLNHNNTTNQAGTTANTGRGQRGHQTTTERQHIPRGLQGNASGQMQRGNQMQGNNAGQQSVQTSAGTNVRFTPSQRTRIRETIINAGNAPRAGQVNFNVRVGTVIPRTEINTIRVIPVPEYLVRIEPRWRGLEYFVFRDAMVIVNPRDMRIVAVIPA